VCILGQPETQVVCVDAGIEDVQRFFFSRNRNWLRDDEYTEKIQNVEEQDTSLCQPLFFSRLLVEGKIVISPL
jgi:hypothetical protein